MARRYISCKKCQYVLSEGWDNLKCPNCNLLWDEDVTPKLSGPIQIKNKVPLLGGRLPIRDFMEKWVWPIFMCMGGGTVFMSLLVLLVWPIWALLAPIPGFPHYNDIRDFTFAIIFFWGYGFSVALFCVVVDNSPRKGRG